MCIRDSAINKSNWTKSLLPLIQVDLGVTSTIALIDSGSTRTLISQEIADKLLEHHLVKRSQAMNIKCCLLYTSIKPKAPVLTQNKYEM